MLKIEFKDLDEVQNILKQLAAASVDLTPASKAIGERLVETTKRRFSTSTDPDGNRWKNNTITTLIRHANRYKTSYTKKGRLSQSGVNRITGKNPLIGESKSLSKTINYRVSKNRALIGSSLVYAATQQFGAKKGSFGKNAPWGDIPTRPHLGLSTQDETDIINIMKDHFLRSTA